MMAKWRIEMPASETGKYVGRYGLAVLGPTGDDEG
jgi:hypothetical protein